MFPQPLCIYPSPEDLDTIGKLGKCIAKGGASEVHTDSQRRAADLEENNQDHAIGDLAIALYLRGSAGAAEVAKSLAARIGSDGSHLFPIPGLAVNCKASNWRTKKGLAGHRLAVRPGSMQAGAIYIPCLVPPPQYRFLLLLGYATTEMLPAQVEDRRDSPFRGAYVLPVRDLQPLMPLKWTVRDTRIKVGKDQYAWVERDLVKLCPDDLIEEIEAVIGVSAAERWRFMKSQHADTALQVQTPTANGLTAAILNAGVTP